MVSIIAYFEISGQGFNTGETMDMSISIDEKYKKCGLSRKMVKVLCEYIQGIFPNIRKDQLLFIDTDASWDWKNGKLTSFWEYIGMKPSRYYIRGNGVDREGKGFELGITFLDLCNWAGASTGLLRGGKKFIKSVKKRYKKKKSKRYHK